MCESSGDLAFQPLPVYSAAGFAWQVTEKSYPREVRQTYPDSIPDSFLPELTAGAIISQHMPFRHEPVASEHESSAQVEVQEVYGKQSPQRYLLDPPGPKSVTGEDTSTHNRGMGGPLARLPLSVQPGEVLVQVCITTSTLLLDARKCISCNEVLCKIQWSTFHIPCWSSFQHVGQPIYMLSTAAVYWWTDSLGFAGAVC